MHILSNNHITAQISPHGAELHSLLHNGFEYIWQADSKYWSRYAPILFPIVGKAHNTLLPQHGFARDSDFQLIDSTDTQATFRLRDTPETLKLYPYKFELTVKYTLSDTRLTVTYTVHNIDDKDIYFQIGGHPAFNLPNYPFSRGYLQLFKEDSPLTEITVKRPNTSGYITEYEQHIDLTNGTLSITSDLLDNGALILENNQCDTIRMINCNGTTHLELTSKDAKLIGIWSPEHTNAPFISIEPWLGCADSEDYQGDFKDRPYTSHLAPCAEHTFGYTILIANQ